MKEKYTRVKNITRQVAFDYISSDCSKLKITQETAYSVTINPLSTQITGDSQRIYLEEQLKSLNEMGVQYIGAYEYQKYKYHLHLVMNTEFAEFCRSNDRISSIISYIKPTDNLGAYINYSAKNIEKVGVKDICMNATPANKEIKVDEQKQPVAISEEPKLQEQKQLDSSLLKENISKILFHVQIKSPIIQLLKVFQKRVIYFDDS